MERSKFVATKVDLVQINNLLSNVAVMEACKERAKTKWKFTQLTIVTLIWFTPRNFIGSKNALPPERVTETPLLIV